MMIDHSRLPTAKVFYMTLSAGNADGTVDMPEAIECIADNVTEALDLAVAINKQHPDLPCFVYRCKLLASATKDIVPNPIEEEESHGE